MATETLKAATITSLDATPPVRGTAGAGAPGGRMTYSFGTVQPTTAVTTGSIYRMVRVPTNCYIHKVESLVDGTRVTLTGDVTIYYSDQTLDEVGLGQGNTGLVNSLSGASSLFAAAHTFGADTAGVLVDLTDVATKYPPTAWSQPLWQAAGLTVDPGGFFDVVVVTTATSSLTAPVNLALRVQYMAPYA